MNKLDRYDWYNLIFMCSLMGVGSIWGFINFELHQALALLGLFTFIALFFFGEVLVCGGLDYGR